MRKLILSLVSFALFLVPAARATPFAAAVVSYNPGTGYAAGFTNPGAVLGQPASNNVTPYAPPYMTNQLVSIGAGGWLTVEFDHPLAHYPQTSRDFIIFGNSFFILTNSAEQSTSGAVYDSGGQTVVSISRDGRQFYALNPDLAPQVGAFYPSDGTGDFQLPVDPALGTPGFAGLTLAQIRLLYNGSAGGASYDAAWAQDTNGNPVALPDFRFVRVDVLTNRTQIAGFAAIEGTVLAETFSNNPAADGWRVSGDGNLFAWDSAAQQLNVTWDSSQTNSYFYHSLGTILTTNDAFSLTFDLTLSDAAVPAGLYQFEAALGFLNFAEATGPGFLRGTGDNATNLAEFDYYPADNLGSPASLDATIIDSAGDYTFSYDDQPLQTATQYHVILRHAAGGALLTGEILTNGGVYSALPDFYSDGTNSFQLDTVAVENYDGADSYSGILAHGVVRNLFVTAPPPPVGELFGQATNGLWQASFWSRTNWIYTLQKTADFRSWSTAGPSVPGTGSQLQLTDPAPAGQEQFYRVSATPQ